MTRFLWLVAVLSALVFAAAGCQAAPQQPPAQPATQQPPAQPAAQKPPAQPTAQQPTVVPAFPTRPIELIVPYSAGGGSGLTAEMMKKIVSDDKLSPQPIDHLPTTPGASGQIGWAYLAGRKGDGHSIATATAQFSIDFIVKNTPLTPEDFTPIAVMAQDQQIMVTPTGSPYKALKDVVDASKKAPQSVKVGGIGGTSPDSTVAAMLELESGIKLNMIPFVGGGESTAAVLGGHVDLVIGNPAELVPHMEAGKLRALAVFADSRLPMLKDIPTAKEQGHNVTFFTPRGVIAPAGIAVHEKSWIVGLMKNITESNQWAEYTSKNMMTANFVGGDDYAKFQADERAKLLQVYTSMGLIKK